MKKQYETVIGLEVHIELSTKTKIFCGCPNDFGGKPNTHICPVCAGMPGALPVLNRNVVDYALKAGLAMKCKVHTFCKFDRKNYFYPDNPQNYQISQLYLPICYSGSVDIDTSQGEKRIHIHEMHMEEDAGKLIHDIWTESSLVDFNRSGVPLIEIVSEPDMRNAEEVIAYLEQLRMMAQYLGISDCRLEEGSMRADVNLSIREEGAKTLGIRTEMKNLNSFKAIARAIEGETMRQIELLEEGREIIQETRRWDDNKECSFPMRSKEDAKDYRYFPDPDLPPIVIDEEWIKRLKAEQPELRNEKKKRFIQEFALSEFDADILTESKNIADLFEKTAKISCLPKKAANWMTQDAMRLMKELGSRPESVKFSPDHLAALIQMEEEQKITHKAAKEVFEQIFDHDEDPVSYVELHHLKTVADIGVLEKVIDEVISEYPDSVAQYRGGKEKVFGFFIGQIMKKMKGQAEPALTRQLLQKKLR